MAGAGVFGAWTALRLRLSGRSVALLEALGPGNARSSSGGESRIIRCSYGPDEIYTRSASRSLIVWKQFFEETNRPNLFHPTGVLWTAPAGSPRASSNLEALANSGVRFDQLGPPELERRFPQIRFDSPVTAIWEPEGGVLLARRAVQAVVEEAVRLGVDHIQAAAEAPAGTGRVAQIHLGGTEAIAAGDFVYACGPWLPKVFPNLLGDRIHPSRQEVFFFGPPPSDPSFAPPAMPAWLDHADPRGGYAIPDIEARGFKLAFDVHGPQMDPDTATRVVSRESLDVARAFVRDRIPGLAMAPIVETRVCQYENTTNGDFLIDRHPDFENVWITGGGSGHGFKHGPAVGEYVEQLLSGSAEMEPRFSIASKTAARARAVY